MLDFQAVRDGNKTVDDLIAGLTRQDLINLTHEMIDTILELIQECDDASVVFVPDDPDAHDPFAESAEEVDLPWTLGHVIVHINASSEESAALSAELARGVKFHGRSRYEVPWESVKTIEQCRHLVEQSRRICLSSLEMWPDNPHLDNYYQWRPKAPRLNALSRFVYGLSHADSHLIQIQKIIDQAAGRKS